MTLLGHSTLPTTPDIKYYVRKKCRLNLIRYWPPKFTTKKSIRNSSVRPGWNTVIRVIICIRLRIKTTLMLNLPKRTRRQNICPLIIMMAAVTICNTIFINVCNGMKVGRVHIVGVIIIISKISSTRLRFVSTPELISNCRVLVTCFWLTTAVATAAMRIGPCSFHFSLLLVCFVNTVAFLSVILPLNISNIH